MVGILIGSADGKMSEREVQKLREVIKTKVTSEKNDLHLLFKKMAEGDLDGQIANINMQTSGYGSVEEKAAFLIGKLEGLNKAFPKLDRTYAKQYRHALHDIAVVVANSTGGVLGIGRVSHEEAELLDLPFIDKP